MKCKQTTDLSHPAAMKTLLDKFQEAYAPAAPKG
jgi:hypothetical protein